MSAGVPSPSQQPEAPAPQGTPAGPTKKLMGASVIKWVFALEYALQGLVNPFQGATFQPFFNHLRNDYGVTEAGTQSLFAKSYLAWSFKPVIGFLIDAYGKTKTLLVVLLSIAVFSFAFAPVIDTGPAVFFWSMFVLSVALAATDVAVDRATVIEGEEESRSTGRSKSTTVGLNQAICWMAIYGTSIFSAVLGGYVAEHVRFDYFMVSLALVPLGVLFVVLRLPKDRAVPIPLKHSVMDFWRGLNTGPVLAVMFFSFIFNFQPAMGTLWNDHLIKNLGFTQTELGISDGASWAGYFLGVVAFAWKGVGWQDRYGLRRLFRLYILASILIQLTQYLLVDPWFSRVTAELARLFGGAADGTVRLAYLCTYNLAQGFAFSLLRMSIFSLVGAVVPIAAAGSLFAGFMSVQNLSYSFSYSSGAWLYDNGSQFAFVRTLEQALFGVPVAAGEHLSVSMLLLINSAAFLLSFVCVHVLPNRRETVAVEGELPAPAGPERWALLERSKFLMVGWVTLAAGITLLGLCLFAWGLDIISAVMACFFLAVLLRKLWLDALLRRAQAATT